MPPGNGGFTGARVTTWEWAGITPGRVMTLRDGPKRILRAVSGGGKDGRRQVTPRRRSVRGEIWRIRFCIQRANFTPWNVSKESAIAAIGGIQSRADRQASA